MFSPCCWLDFANHNGCIDRVWIVARKRMDVVDVRIAFRCSQQTPQNTSFVRFRPMRDAIFNSKMHAKRLVFLIKMKTFVSLFHFRIMDNNDDAPNGNKVPVTKAACPIDRHQKYFASLSWPSAFRDRWLRFGVSSVFLSVCLLACLYALRTDT